MSKPYVLYASRADFEAHRSLGMFTRDELEAYVRQNDVGNKAVVLETRLLGNIFLLSELGISAAGNPPKAPAKTPQPPKVQAKPKYKARPLEFEEICYRFYMGAGALIILLVIGLLIAVAIKPNTNSTPSALERAERKARNYQAHAMTPAEAEAFRKKQEADSIQHRAYINTVTEARQSKYSDRDMEIYRHMRSRFENLGDGYNPSIHDDMIAREAASRFGVSANEATNIYIKVDSN